MAFPLTDSPTPAEALRAARERAETQTAFAELIGYTQGAVSKLLARGGVCPHDKVLLVEEKTGVPRWQLRPDIYPPEEYANRADPDSPDERTPPDATLDRRPAQDRAA